MDDRENQETQENYYAEMRRRIENGIEPARVRARFGSRRDLAPVTLRPVTPSTSTVSGTVTSITAASADRSVELAALARRERAIADMRYQRAARRPGVDTGLGFPPGE